jgi:HD-GYP domain-containing protein (c-di-GMP phosphodiesterase class II)
MAVADIYDALRSNRVYKSAVAHAEACEMINSSSGTHLDPGMVSAFWELKGEFNVVSEKVKEGMDDWLGDNPEGGVIAFPT